MAQGEDILTPATAQFIRDAEKHGLEVRFYAGRNSYFGPAVRVDDLTNDFYTSALTKWDNLGKGFVIYLAESDTEWYEEQAS